MSDNESNNDESTSSEIQKARLKSWFDQLCITIHNASDGVINDMSDRDKSAFNKMIKDIRNLWPDVKNHNRLTLDQYFNKEFKWKYFEKFAKNLSASIAVGEALSYYRDRDRNESFEQRMIDRERDRNVNKKKKKPKNKTKNRSNHGQHGQQQQAHDELNPSSL